MLKNLLYNAVSFDVALPFLRNLWHEAFGDSLLFIDAFMRCFEAENCVHTLSMDGVVVAALYVLPYDLCYDGSLHRVAYVYAVATDEKYRGRGIMRSLMERVHETLRCEGYAAALLLPSSKRLADYYGSMGYVACASRKCRLLRPSVGAHTAYSLERAEALDSDIYDFLGHCFSCRSNGIVHSRAALEVNRLGCSFAGGGLFMAREGRNIVAAAFLSIIEGQPLLLDVSACSSDAQDFIIGALCREFAVEALPLLVLDEKEGAPFAMALPFDSDFPATISLELMLDK